jgi:hypothetical protein
MSDLITAIPRLRESVVALLRIRPARPATVKKGKAKPAQFQAVIGGTGFCVVRDRFVVTAFHVLNGGQPRNPKDRFYALVVPGNGDPFFHFPVNGFTLERPEIDVAILELGPCATAGISLPAAAVSFTLQPDGTRVITLGFPAPEIAGLGLDAEGAFLGGQFFLKSHANEGIVSAQYAIGNVPVYELNVGWHHGESGGPIATLAEPPAVFSLMQQYRNIQSPHGVVAGPHRGCGLLTIQKELSDLGVLVE